MKSLHSLTLGTFSTAALAAGWAGASPPIYNQPSDGTDGWYASQNDVGGLGNFATTYDDFTLGSNTKLFAIDWTGVYSGTPSAPITGFTLTIYADNAGQPGAALYTDTIVGNANETANGLTDGFDYSAAANFTVHGGTTYWLSIVPDLQGHPQWGWGTGTGGDGINYQDFFGTRSQNPSDMAFSLFGTIAAPEPAAWALMLGGFAGLGAALRSRRREVSAVV